MARIVQECQSNAPRRNRRIRRFVRLFYIVPVIVVIAAIQVLLGSPASRTTLPTPTRPSVSVSQQASALQLDFRFPTLATEKVLTKAGVRTTIAAEWAVETRGGNGKAVFVYSALIALPPKGLPTLRVLRSEWDTLQMRWEDLADFPDATGFLDSPGTERHSSVPELTEAGTLRGYRLGRVSIPLVQRAATGAVLALRRIRLELRMPAPIATTRPAPDELRSLVLNPDWLSAVPPQLSPAPGQQGLVRVCTVDSGMVKITGADLEEAGIDPGGIDVSNLRIRHRGAEMPVLTRGLDDGKLDPEDELIFYAAPLHGDTCFFHPYSDTNIFWIGWDEGLPPGRYVSLATPDRGQVVPDSVVLHTLHLERELRYNYGDDDLTIKITDPVPGEGWMWHRFYRGDELAVPFELRDLADTDSVVVRVHVRGASPYGTVHQVQVRVNGSELGTRSFPTRLDTTLTFRVPPQTFHENDNEIRIRSPGQITTGEVDQWYLDWIEILYPRRLIWRPGGQLDVWLPGIREERRWAVRIPEGTSPAFVYVDQGVVLRNVTLSRAYWDSIRIISAGYDDGDRCEIWVRGQRVVARGSRGHNVVALDPRTGAILAIRTFDTYRDSVQANALASFIRSLPDSAVVLVGIRDDGQASMTEQAYRALEDIGSAFCRSVGYRDSWCIVGRKGATPGTVPEKLVRRGNGIAVTESLEFFPDGGPLRACWTDTTREAHHLVVFDEDRLPGPPQIQVDEPGHLLEGPGAEYLIITHRQFRQQANRLADYRRSRSGLSARTVDVQDVYDEFNYGLPAPEAIRHFLAYAFWTGSEPRPRYVLLFGDASWDPRRTSEGAKAVDFVPTFGLPVSDSRLVCVDGPEDRLPDLPIGRLPVKTPEEARHVVDKIIEYESLEPGKWTKRFLFITGGFDQFEQTLFALQSRSLAHELLEPPPAAMQWVMISKQTEGYLEGEGREDILRHIDRGILWANFIGHAGSRTWDLMFHNPDIDALDNGPYYPFVTSMTCHTARFANPYQESFGERFVLTEGRGAVGFLGTSGWGYVYRDEVLLRALLSRAFRDTVRGLGDLVWLGKLDFWALRFGDALDQTIVDQYSLLGDPALNLALPTVPDLAITPDDVVPEPEHLSIADSSVEVTVRVWNYGLATTESTEVSIQIRDPSGIVNGPVELPIGEVGLVDSVEFRWRPADPGEHVLTISVDPFSRIPDANPGNNSVSKTIRVESGLAEILWPINGCELPADRPVLALIRRPSDESLVSGAEILVDTSKSFRSPLQRIDIEFGSEQPVRAVDLGTLPTGTYYLALRSNGAQFAQPGSIRRFRVSEQPAFAWSQHGLELAESLSEFTRFSREGAGLGMRRLKIEVASAGYDDGNFARILIDGQPAMETFRGHNVCLIDRFGKLRTRNFDTHASRAQAESLATFLRSVGRGTVFAIAVRDDGSARMTESAYDALEALGSRYCRSVGYRDSWAMIGIVGDPGSVREVWRPRGQGVAQILDTCSVYADSAEIVGPWIGPSAGWEEFSISVSGQRGKIDYELRGRASLSAPDSSLLFGQIEASDRAARIDISESPHRFLSPRALFAAPDSGVLLSHWRLRFKPPAELIPLRLDVQPSNPQVGARLQLRLTVLNCGPGDSGPAIATCLWRDQDGDWRTVGHDSLPPLAAGDSVRLSWTWRTTPPAGPVPIRVTVDPDDRVAELDETNNRVVQEIELHPDSAAPVIRFAVDGRELTNQDYVPSRFHLEVRVIETSHYELKDSTLIAVLVDGRSLAEVAESRPEVRTVQDGGMLLSAPINLEPGSHLIEAQARDLAGNRAEAWLTVQVSDELRIERLLNYPNPFGNETSFTYFLTQPADRVIIRVFTLAGRKVWETDAAPAHAGFNAFDWDGRDQDGDPLANGVYIYTVEARAGDQEAQALSKLVIMR